jgi:hypothetical protein
VSKRLENDKFILFQEFFGENQQLLHWPFGNKDLIVKYFLGFKQLNFCLFSIFELYLYLIPLIIFNPLLSLFNIFLFLDG